MSHEDLVDVPAVSLGRLLRRVSRIDTADDDESNSAESWLSTVERVRSRIRSSLSTEQLALFDSTNRWDAACCARQCGKTYTAARLLIDTALRIDDSIGVYVSDTWDNAVKVMWVDQEDGLPAVLESLGMVDRDARGSGGRRDPEWHYHINLSSRTVTFRNGSIIELAGADRGAWSKFRGRKLNLIIADEMQRQHQGSLERALRSDLPDCFNVRRGRFVGIGTVGRALSGIWFEVNADTHGLCPHRPGWSGFHWTARELSHLTNAWEEQLSYARAMGIDVDSDPEFMREKRGKWVRDEQSLLHALTERSIWDGRVPDGVRTRCREHAPLRIRCVCDLPLVPRSAPLQRYAGLDLGFGDPSAVVVGSISREEGVLREEHSEQRAGLDTSQIAAWLREVMERHSVVRFYCDPAWRLTVEDLRRLYGLPVESAIKGDAEGTTEDLWHSERQASLRTGHLQVLRGSVLHGQLEGLLRDPSALEDGHIRTAPGQDDHATDAWRYLFRMVRTRHVEFPEPPEAEGDRMTRELSEHRSRLLNRPSDRDPVRDRRDRARNR